MENLNSNQVTEDSMPSLSERNGEDLFAQENEIRFQSSIHEEIQPMSEVRPQSLVPKYAASPHIQDPTP